MLSHINKELEELKFPLLGNLKKKKKKMHTLLKYNTLVKQLTQKAFKDRVLLIKTKHRVGFFFLTENPKLIFQQQVILYLRYYKPNHL